MDRIRHWLNRYRSREPERRDMWPTAGEQTAMGERAANVITLQAEVSRLQQEILAVSNDLARDQPVETRNAAMARMAELEQALEKAQRDLGKFQARI